MISEQSVLRLIDRHIEELASGDFSIEVIINSLQKKAIKLYDKRNDFVNKTRMEYSDIYIKMITKRIKQFLVIKSIAKERNIKKTEDIFKLLLLREKLERESAKAMKNIPIQKHYELSLMNQSND